MPAWSIQEPNDPEAIQILVDAWMESDADIRHVVKTMLKSDFFREARMKRVKSPTNFVANVLKISGDYRDVDVGLETFQGTLVAMGQTLMDPPSVEGWHTGKEWIDGGTLTERVNFAVDTLSDSSKPGVRAIIDAVRDLDAPRTPEKVVDVVLEHLCRLDVDGETKDALVEHAYEGGDFDGDTEERILRLITLAVSTREFQFE